ncbi:MAG: T9SS type A sorting domain-containing protein [Parafilimonas sp.]
MKKTLLLIPAFLCFVLMSTAQGPTLTAANTTPQIGELFQNQFAKSANVNDKSGGANQTWDYSNLVDSNAIFNLLAVTPASTPFADSFPGSNLAMKTVFDSAYLFFNAQSSQLTQLGVAGSDSTILRYTTPRIYMPYPFSYNSFYTDSVVEVAAEFPVALRGKDSLSGDGYGTLKTPLSTYNNVLRVKYIEHFTYSYDTLGLKATVTISTTSYLYFTPDTHAPLLSNQLTQVRTTESFLGTILFDTSIYNKYVYYLKGVSLPLSFVSFNASLNNREVALQWQTAQEINTDNFNVQRSLTGTDFTDVAAIKATGNSSAVSQYNYTDMDFIKSGVPSSVFYRIKETDKDGKEFYSSTAVVHGTTSIVSLYPNPVTNYLHLNIKDVSVADAITMYDAKGHLVKQFFNYQLSQPINVSDLGKGSYFVQIKIKDKTTTTTIIKQ